MWILSACGFRVGFSNVLDGMRQDLDGFGCIRTDLSSFLDWRGWKRVRVGRAFRYEY